MDGWICVSIVSPMTYTQYVEGMLYNTLRIRNVVRSVLQL